MRPRWLNAPNNKPMAVYSRASSKTHSPQARDALPAESRVNGLPRFAGQNGVDRRTIGMIAWPSCISQSAFLHKGLYVLGGGTHSSRCSSS